MVAATAGSWWVGENITNQNSFRLGNPFSNNAPSGYQAVQAGNATDAAAFAQSLSSGNLTPNLHGIAWRIVGGPYATEAEAKAAIPAIQKKTPAPGALQQAVAPIAGLEAVAHILGDIGRAVTDGKMWRSVGWILLGIIIFGFGLLLWLRKPIEQAVGTAAKAVAF